MPGKLKNAHIVISRPEHDSVELSRQIIASGGTAVCIPLFATDSLLTPTYIAKIMEMLPKCSLVVCVSKNAAQLLLPNIRSYLAANSQQLWATIGPATAEYLKRSGVQKLIFPQQEPFDSAALLQALQINNINLKNQYIMLLTGEDGNNSLAEGLQRIGAAVDTTPIYRRVLPPNAALLFNQALNAEPRINIIVITCVTSIVNLLYLAEQKGIAIYDMPLLVVSKRIYDFAIAAGFKKIYNSNGMSVDAIMAALTAWWTK